MYGLEHVSVVVKKTYANLLITAFRNFLNYLHVRKMPEVARDHMLTAEMLRNQAAIEDQQAYRNVLFAQNCIKAYVYLLTWFLADYSKLRAQAPKEIGGTRSKKKNPQDQGERDVEQIQGMLLEGVSLLNQLVAMEVHHFFPSHKIEEDVVKKLINSGFEMIECTQNLKNSDIKESVFRLLE